MQTSLGQEDLWHDQGLYFGMHWAWWIFWILTVLVLLWALWRVHTDRIEAHRDAERHLDAEDVLRQRFARGEISEEEYTRGLQALATEVL